MLNISVIIPVYNAEKHLEKAVKSALQFEEVKEVLLIEDASPDNSLALCNELTKQDERVQLFQHSDKGNHGAGASRNLGLEKATQDYIAFLDADDYYLPNRFDAEKKLFQDEKIEGVFGAIGTEFLTEKGKQAFQEKFKNINLTTVHYHTEGKEVFRGLLGLNAKVFGTFFHLNGLTIVKKSLVKNKLQFNPNLRVHQDSDFITKLAFHCHLKTGMIDKAIAIRGVHDDNRITKIKTYSKKYNERQFLLWKSLHSWSVDNQLNRDEKEKIRLKYVSFKLANSNLIKTILLLPLEIIKNADILKTRYRFIYLKR